ncbi:MAG: FadR/GntR family transcriptional regulator [Cellulomonadaceae bacterium]
MSAENRRRVAVEIPSFQVAPQTIAAELAAHLERLIVSGEVEPGALLPPERTLAADFGISRATVRGALAELESKRLIERRQGRGSTVLGPAKESIELAGMLAGSSPEVRNALELRRIVEPQVARIATLRALASDLLSLRRAVDLANEHLTPAESMAMDVQFHLLLARATQNPLLPTVMEFSFACTENVRLLSHQTQARRRTSLHGHRDILAAVVARDPEAAQAAMIAHLTQVEEIRG